MGWSRADTITVQERDFTNELLGKIGFGTMAFLGIQGRMPSAEEARVFNALLVTLVEHGMRP
jgi:citrate synthase